MLAWTGRFMPSSLRKRLTKFVLKRAIGKYLKNELDLNQVDVQIGDGRVELNNLELNSEVLNEMVGDQPFVITCGYVGSITITIPWSNIWQEGCTLHVERLEITVASRTGRRARGPSADGSVMSSVHLAAEFVDREGYRGLEEEVNSMPQTGPGGEGLDMIRAMVDNILERVHVSARHVVLRLEHSMAATATKAVLLLSVPELSVRDETPLRQTVASPDGGGVSSAAEVAWKVVRLRHWRLQLAEEDDPQWSPLASAASVGAGSMFGLGSVFGLFAMGDDGLTGPTVLPVVARSGDEESTVTVKVRGEACRRPEVPPVEADAFMRRASIVLTSRQCTLLKESIDAFTASPATRARASAPAFPDEPAAAGPTVAPSAHEDEASDDGEDVFFDTADDLLVEDPDASAPTSTQPAPLRVRVQCVDLDACFAHAAPQTEAIGSAGGVRVGASHVVLRVSLPDRGPVSVEVTAQDARVLETDAFGLETQFLVFPGADGRRVPAVQCGVVIPEDPREAIRVALALIPPVVLVDVRATERLRLLINAPPPPRRAVSDVSLASIRAGDEPAGRDIDVVVRADAARVVLLFPPVPDLAAPVPPRPVRAERVLLDASGLLLSTVVSSHPDTSLRIECGGLEARLFEGFDANPPMHALSAPLLVCSPATTSGVAATIAVCVRPTAFPEGSLEGAQPSGAFGVPDGPYGGLLGANAAAPGAAAELASERALTRVEAREMQRCSLDTAEMAVSLELPRVSGDFSKRSFDVVYARLLDLLAVLASLTPAPAAPPDASSPATSTLPAPMEDFSDSECEEDECASDSGTARDGPNMLLAFAPLDAAPRSLAEKARGAAADAGRRRSGIALRLLLGEGELRFTETLKPTEDATPAVMPPELLTFLLAFSDASVFVASQLMAQDLVVCHVHGRRVALREGAAAWSPRTVIEPTPDGGGGGGSDEGDVLAVSVLVDGDSRAALQEMVVACNLAGVTLHHRMVSSWLFRMVDFFAEPMPWPHLDMIPSLGNGFVKLRLNATRAGISYRPVYLPSSALVDLQTLRVSWMDGPGHNPCVQVSANIVQASPTFSLKVTARNAVLSVAGGLEHGLEEDRPVAVLSLDEGEVFVRTQKGGLPKFEVEISDRLATLAVCADTLRVFGDLVAYFAADGDLHVPGEPSPAAAEPVPGPVVTEVLTAAEGVAQGSMLVEEHEQSEGPYSFYGGAVADELASEDDDDGDLVRRGRGRPAAGSAAGGAPGSPDLLDSLEEAAFGGSTASHATDRGELSVLPTRPPESAPGAQPRLLGRTASAASLRSSDGTTARRATLEAALTDAVTDVLLPPSAVPEPSVLHPTATRVIEISPEERGARTTAEAEWFVFDVEVGSAREGQPRAASQLPSTVPVGHAPRAAPGAVVVRVAADAETAWTARGEKVTSYVGEEGLGFVEDHFRPPETAHNDAVRLPDKFPPPLERFAFRDFSFRIMLYDGFDFRRVPAWSASHTTPPGDTPKLAAARAAFAARGRGRNAMELSVAALNASYTVFAPDAPYAFHVALDVRDIEIRDRLRRSAWNKFLCYLPAPDQPRSERSSMVRVAFDSVRPGRPDTATPATTTAPLGSPTEYRFKIALLPLRLNVDQDAVLFLIELFTHSHGDVFLRPSATTPGVAVPPTDGPFIQYFEVKPVRVRLDYKPKRVDYHALRGGQLLQLLNFFYFQDSELALTRVRLTGVGGWTRLGEALAAAWVPHVRSTQIPSLIGGLVPLRSVVNVGAGVADLVLLPLEQYSTDGRVLRGVQRGAESFLRATAVEAASFAARAAIVTKAVLAQMDDVLAPADPDAEEDVEQRSQYASPPASVAQGVREAMDALAHGVEQARHTIVAVPLQQYERTGTGGYIKSVVRAVPVAVLRAGIGTTEAVARTMIGIQSALDPALRAKMLDKYKPGSPPHVT